MTSNYFKIAIRQIKKSPLYTVLNVLGLSVGFGFSLLLLLGVHNETKVDRFHEDIDQIYKSYFYGIEEETGEIPFVQGASPYALYTELRTMDGVVESAIIDDFGEIMVEVNGKKFKEKSFIGSASIFNILSIPLVEGSVQNGYSDPKTVYISEDVAKRYFGIGWKGNTVGQVINVNQETDYTIAGIVNNTGSKSNYSFDIMLNVDQLAIENGEDFAEHWGAKFGTVISKLNLEVDKKQIESQIDLIYKDKRGFGVGGDAMMLFPLSKDHLWSKFENGIASGGKIEYVRIFSWSAIFLLIIACINFINLSTAQASKRAKEVGIRKTVGAEKSSLIKQFLSETGVLISIAITLSLLAVHLIIPSINSFLDTSLALPWSNINFWIILSASFGVLTILSGLYPAFILSGYKTIKVLNKSVKPKYGQQFVRKGLVVFQFVLSAILIISTLLINKQVNYIMTQNFGLDRNNVIHVNMPPSIAEKYEPLKIALERDPNITHVVRSTDSPTDIGWINMGFEWEGIDPDNAGYFYQLQVEPGFDKMFAINMKEGRFFDKNIESDKDGIVINEKALDFIQMENPVGKTIYDDEDQYTILGIVENFPFTSIHNEVEPLMIRYNAGRGGTLMIKSNPENTALALASIGNAWKELFPDYPFDYTFLDDQFAQMYKTESVMGTISWYLAGIAIIISCLGLFGLITFLASQKAKEIGIRKVLGASVLSIIGLLSKDFLKLIVLGLIIAIPLSWYIIDMWLENFAYRVNIEWWTFALAGTIAIVLAMVTISFQSIKAARTNPIKAIRTE